MTLTEHPLNHQEPEVPNAGSGYYRPKQWGLYGFGFVGSGVAVIAIAVAAGALLLVGGSTGRWIAVASVVIGGLILLWAAFPDRHGLSTMARSARRRGYRRAHASGTTKYTPGGLTDMGTHRLPGALADSHLSTWTTADGEEFAVLVYPRTSTYAVSVTTQPDGASLLDEAEKLQKVRAYGDWLAYLSTMPDFLEGIVTIETSPHSGPLMRKTVTGAQSDRAQPLSRAVIGELLDQYPLGTQGVSVTVTAAFHAPAPEIGMDGKPIPRSERESEEVRVGRLLVDRVPRLFEKLPHCGAGSVRLIGTEELIERVRVAYNPQARKAYEDARAKGQPRPVTLWSSVGPSAAEEHWNWYQIGGDGAAITWEFTGFTAPFIQADALLPLLQGDATSTTRISIIFRPLPPEKSTRAVERNYNSATGRLDDARKPTAKMIRDVTHANQARFSEAQGHALTDFTVLVTKTVDDKAMLPRVRASIQQLGPSARLQLRPCDGQQAVMFAQGIGPLGLVANRHLRMPQGLMNGN